MVEKRYHIWKYGISFFRYSQNFILINTSTFLLFFHYVLLLCPTFFILYIFFSVHNSYPSSTSSTLPSHFLSLLVFPLKSAFFPLFRCYFVDIIIALLYYNRYSTFCCFLWKFVASWHRYICFYIRLISILLIIYIFYTYDFHIKRCPDRRYQECICLS